MAKLDGVSKLYYHDEVRDFVAAGIAKLQATQKRGFAIRNMRLVERKVSSGQKVLYVNRGVLPNG